MNGEIRKLIRKIESHIPGKGCKCGAYGESECGCGVDWRSREEVAGVAALIFLTGFLTKKYPNDAQIKELVDSTLAISGAGYGNSTRKNHESRKTKNRNR